MENKPEIDSDYKGVFSPLIAALFLSIGILIGIFISQENIPTDQLRTNIQKYRQILNLVENEYVDSVDVDQLSDRVFSSFSQFLDPHSSYISKKEKLSFDSQFESTFEGIGVEFNMVEDTLLILGVIPNGPSYKAGVRMGDKILRINEDTVSGVNKTNDEIVNIIRGPGNTKITAYIKRIDVEGVVEIEITRQRIKHKSVVASFMLNDSIGYIKIERFAENTYNEFYESLLKLQQNNLKSLVLDLRQNGGGYLQQATFILDEFIQKGDLLLFTKGKNLKSKQLYYASKTGSFEQGNLVVWVDEFSASASEIVSGALQDNDRAWIIGRRTYGKGLVQLSYDLIDGSAFKLTISRYFTPSGRCIQKPYDRDDLLKYKMDLVNRQESGEFFTLDSVKHNQVKEYKTKSGRIVFEGGGITPDVFVAKDSIDYGKIFGKKFEFYLVNTWAIKASETEFLIYKSLKPEDLYKAKKLSDQIQVSFVNYLKKQNIYPKLHDKKLPKKMMVLLKASLAKCLWGDEEYYKVLALEDSYLGKSWDFLKPVSIESEQLNSK